jgi:hypothetical protein
VGIRYIYIHIYTLKVEELDQDVQSRRQEEIQNFLYSMQGQFKDLDSTAQSL